MLNNILQEFIDKFFSWVYNELAIRKIDYYFYRGIIIMKKIITLALALVMAMVLLTACGPELHAPDGTYSTDSGAYKVYFTNYDAKENVGDLTVAFTYTGESVSGKYTVAVNDEEAQTYFIDFTPDGGEEIVSFGIYGLNENAFVQLEGLEALGGQTNITYNYGDVEVD